MPIRAEFRKFYRADWRRFRLTMLELAGNVCQRCGRPHRMLNLAHLSHDPADRKRVAVLCPSCHARHDTKQRVATTRRTRARRRGQLWLSMDLERATVPVRLLPPKLRQMELFGSPELDITHSFQEVEARTLRFSPCGARLRSASLGRKDRP